LPQLRRGNTAIQYNCRALGSGITRNPRIQKSR
jgi:hypothetical protein